MILENGTIDTKDHGIGGKFDSDMAVYLDHLWMNGDQGDDQATHPVNSEGAARYGKWVLFWDEQGFVGAQKLATIAEAELCMNEWHAHCDDDDEDEEAEQESAF